MFQALLFDMDGVLLDTELQTFNIWNKFLKETQNYNLSKEDYSKISGSPPWEFERFISLNLPGDANTLLKHWGNEIWRYINEGSIPTLSGYEKLIKYLEDYPYKKAIVTSNGSTWMKGYLRLFKFEEIFDAVFAGDNDLPRKPSPEPYLNACNKLCINPKNALAIEDSQSGISAALAAGLSVVRMRGISHVRSQTASRCLYEVQDLNELVKLLKKLELKQK